MKEGLKSMTAVQLAALRISIGGIVFAPFVIRFLRKIEKGDLKYVILAGILGNGIPAFLFAIAQTQVESSVAGALNALTPLFTILIGYAFGVIVLNTSKIGGVVLGLIGALAIILGKSQEVLTFNNAYTLLVVAATICYGANINLIKSKLYKYHPVVISALPLFFISIPGLAILFTSDLQPMMSIPKPQLWSSVIAIVLLALLGNSLSLILFNRLIQLSGPLFASSVTYFIPVVAMIWGFADGEKISAIQLSGLLLILLGIYLVNKRIKESTD
jgi:drug/metabolite transporter (DMT)-like permease